jgi:ubiquinone/menaquinone biosynthesis C-methylase UbiE
VHARPVAPTPPPRPPARYEQGDYIRGHQKVLERAADLAVSAVPMPLRVLDVGCGDGWLIDEMVVRVPYAEIHVGADPLPAVLAATRLTADRRVSLVRCAAEALPFDDASFDLVLVAFSLGYWLHARTGAAELARVVSDFGKVVVVDQVSGREGVGDVSQVLEEAGLVVERTESLLRSPLLRPQVRAYVAAR